MSQINNRYLLQETLGTGGMGTVYAALDRLTGQRIALKRVTATALEEEEARLALAGEFRIMATLRHPHIVSVLDYGFDEDGSPYIIMDLLNNTQTIIAAGQGKSHHEQIEMLLQTLEALRYLHRRGILHRDLKPGNVLVVNGQVKVLDFGLATYQPHGHSEVSAGTIPYMAPEVLQGYAASPATDLYAIGILAFELFVGYHPFRSEFVTDMISDIVSTPINMTPMRNRLTIPTEINQRLIPILERLLAKNPLDRYPNAETTLHAFTRAIKRTDSTESIAIRESYLEAAQFVGREEEISRLSLALLNAKDGIGSAWLVGGESGAGKSRLLEEIRTLALVGGALVLNGQSFREGAKPYNPWRDPLRRLALSIPMTSAEASILSDFIPDIENLVEKPMATPPETDHYTERIAETIVSIFSRTEKTTVLLLDDVHWMSESLEILQRLTSLVSGLPLLVIATYNTDENPKMPDTLTTMKTIHLGRLETVKVTELAQSMLGDIGYRADVLELLQRETEGNIFFLVEAVRVLAEEAGELNRIGGLPLPTHIVVGGIQRIMERRLRRVPPAERPLLELAAIAGRELDRQLLEWLRVSVDIRDLEKWLLVVSDAGVFEFYRNSWRFTHEKLREAIIGDLSPEDKRQRHANVAAGIEELYGESPEHITRLAKHWIQAQVPEKSKYYAQLAGDHSLRVGAAQDAIEFYEHVLEHTHTLRGQAAIYLRLGQGYEHASELETARTCFEESLLLFYEMGDSRGHAKALLCLAEVDIRLGDLVYATERATFALELYQNHTDIVGECHARRLLGSIYYGRGLLDTGIEHANISLKIAREIDDQLTIGKNLKDLGNMYRITGDFANALAHMQEALHIFEKLSARREIGVTYGVLGITYRHTGRITDATDSYEKALEILREIGDRRAEITFQGNLAAIYRSQGKLTKAMESHLHNIELTQESNFVRTEGYNLSNLGTVYRLQGDFDAAQETYERAISTAEQCGDQYLEAYACGNLGLLMLMRDDPKTAEMLLEEAIHQSDEINTPEIQGLNRMHLARLHLVKGNYPYAAELLELADAYPHVDHDAFRTLLKGFTQLHLKQDGTKTLEQAVEKSEVQRANSPSLYEPYFVKGLAQIALGQTEAGTKSISMGLQICSRSGLKREIQQLLDILARLEDTDRLQPVRNLFEI